MRWARRGSQATRTRWACCPWYGVVWLVYLVIGAIGLTAAVLVVVSVFVRRHGASAERRQQLAWLGYVAVLTAVLFVLLIAVGLWRPDSEPAVTVISVLLLLTLLLGIPVACAVAVLKYRLYDLDIVVRKTVVAGLVAAAFTAIYAVVVAGVGVVTGHAGSSALTFAAAALAAVALQPVRARAKLLAGRLVYGRRATPYEVLSDSPTGSPAPFRPMRCCRRWPGCSPRRPAPSGPRCGWAAAAASAWKPAGLPRQ